VISSNGIDESSFPVHLIFVNLKSNLNLNLLPGALLAKGVAVGF